MPETILIVEDEGIIARDISNSFFADIAKGVRSAPFGLPSSQPLGAAEIVLDYSTTQAATAEAVREGCNLRFRPLLMTALTSFIGHLPMLYATGSGADIQKPLAVVVMGGLVTSTALTLLVLPAIYAWKERKA